MSNLRKLLWFTGLSGSGKTTLAELLAHKLRQQNFQVKILDGDVLRQKQHQHLGFSLQHRSQHIQNLAKLANSVVVDYDYTLVTAITPMESMRREAMAIVNNCDIIWVYCNGGLQQCEQCDPKGLYQQARMGLITEFTGIDSPYEEPKKADIVIPTHTLSIEQCLTMLIQGSQLHLSCSASMTQ